MQITSHCQNANNSSESQDANNSEEKSECKKLIGGIMKHPGGRPKGTASKTKTSLTSLCALVAESPKPVNEIMLKAENEWQISERTLKSVWRILQMQLNQSENLMERIEKDGVLVGPWCAFQRGRRWFWGDERKMPIAEPEKQAPAEAVPIWKDLKHIQEIIESEITDEIKAIRDQIEHDCPDWYQDADASKAMAMLSKALPTQYPSEDEEEQF